MTAEEWIKAACQARSAERSYPDRVCIAAGGARNAVPAVPTGCSTVAEGYSVLTAFAIFSDGLVYAAYLFLVAVGLTLIFGVMKILNVTHGSFYAFGAYGAATAAGVWYERGLTMPAALLFMVGLAMLIGLVIGIILERGILRFVYGRDEVVVVLVTYAVFLILEDVLVLVWGPRSYTAYQPMTAAGSIDIGDLTLSNYDIGLVVLAAALAALCCWALKYTRYGRLLTVVIFDRETAAAFGVNVTRPLHRHLHHRRHAGRAGRRGDGAENVDHARHRRRGDRACVRGCRDRRHGLDRGRADRRAFRRHLRAPPPCISCRSSSCSSSMR